MKYFFLLCLFLSTVAFSQNNSVNIFRINSSHTSFPDTARSNGHLYNKVMFDAATNYMDSSVLIIVPKNLDATRKVDMVFWFHGWFNNIDTAVTFYSLIKQFEEAHLNAVLVLPETAKNAPDSYGGKLEYTNTFKELVADILQKLKKEKTIAKQCEAGNILLAGHSGAYRVMAHILQKGNMPVREVILFDALYGQTDKFVDWLKADKTHRFVNIYTDGGGTDGESREMVKTLMKLNIFTDTLEEADLTVQSLKALRILFIHSLRKHNDIINNPDNFQFFLENTTFLKPRS